VYGAPSMGEIMSGMRTWSRVLSLLVVASVLSLTSGCALNSRSPGSTTSVTTKGYGGVPAGTAGMRAGAGEAFSGAAAAPAAAPAATVQSGQLIIRNGSVRVEVGVVTSTVEAIRSLAARYGGVVSDLQLSTDNGGGIVQPLATPERTLSSGLPFSASVTVLVPAARLDALRASVEKLGRVLSESSSDQDVTQEHVDLKARLQNARVEESRLRSFFAAASSVKDMLAIEKELARVRGDIESMTAQLASMDRQIAQATLTIELTQPEPLVRPAGVDWGFGGAVTQGVQTLAAFARGLLVLAIAGSPVWILAIVGYVLIRRRRAAKKSAGSE
jgi:hypothetical protein